MLIARENLLYTFIDYYKEKFKLQPTPQDERGISRNYKLNIFQMDGLKYVVPMSCHHETRVIPGEQTLFEKYQIEWK